MMTKMILTSAQRYDDGENIDDDDDDKYGSDICIMNNEVFK